MNSKAISQAFDTFEEDVRQCSDAADLEYLLLRMNTLLELLERRLAELENHVPDNFRAKRNVFRR